MDHASAATTVLRSLGAGLLSSLMSAVAMVPASADPIALCGRSALSQAQLYFDIAKAPDVVIRRATASVTVLERGSTGELWTFVVSPVLAVLCRGAAFGDAVQSACEGDAAACRSVIERLTADPRLDP